METKTQRFLANCSCEYRGRIHRISTKILKLLADENISVSKAKTAVKHAYDCIDGMSTMTYDSPGKQYGLTDEEWANHIYPEESQRTESR